MIRTASRNEFFKYRFLQVMMVVDWRLLDWETNVVKWKLHDEKVKKNDVEHILSLRRGVQGIKYDGIVQ